MALAHANDAVNRDEISVEEWFRSRAAVTPVTPTRWMSEVDPQTMGNGEPARWTPLIGPRTIAAGAPARLLKTAVCMGPNPTSTWIGAQRPMSVASSVHTAAAQGPSINPTFGKTPKNLSAMSKRHRQDQPCLPLSGGRSSRIFFRLALAADTTPSPGQPDVLRSSAFTLRGTVDLDK